MLIGTSRFGEEGRVYTFPPQTERWTVRHDPDHAAVAFRDAELSWNEWEDELLDRLRSVEDQLRRAGVYNATPAFSRLRSRVMQLFECLR